MLRAFEIVDLRDVSNGINIYRVRNCEQNNDPWQKKICYVHSKIDFRLFMA